MDTLSIVDLVRNNLPALMCALIVLLGIDVVRMVRREQRRTKLPPSGLVTFVGLIINAMLVMGLATIAIGIRGLSMIYLTGR